MKIKNVISEDLPPPENARKTQIAGTLPTYKKAAAMLDKTGVKGKALDFGAGLGLGTGELGKDAESYEPYPGEKFKPHFVDVTQIPDNAYHKIVNLNVLNVVPNAGDQRIRDAIVKNIGRVLAPGGVAIITTRGKDVLTIKGTPGEEPMSMISKIGTYQKGFSQTELKQYVQSVLGDGFDVSSVKLGPAGVMIKKHDQYNEEWSAKYKRSINCSHPKGFSQKAHCAGKKKHNESVEMEMVCEDCGMCQTHGDNTKDKLDELKCWSGYHRVAGTKAGFPGSCAKNKTNEEQDMSEGREQCPECGGAMYSEEMINEKKDACYYKVKSRYKVWPSAYASGALVKCRKKGASNWGNSTNEDIVSEYVDQLDENLHQWFKEKWVRFGPDGKIRGDCARGDDSEGKPKCLPQSKAHNLGKKGRASAASRKRREDPNPERTGPAINVNTKKKSNEGMAEATGDKPFDNMMKGIVKGTTKQATADRKEKEKQSQERARAAFGNMFGGGNPADKLSIRKKTDEGNDFNRMMNKISSSESLHTREALELMSELMHQAGASYKEALQQASLSFEIEPSKLHKLYQQEITSLEEGETWAKHNNPRAGGMSKKSVNSYRRSHPGSKIQTAVTTKPSKLKKGSKAAKRRKSFCARMRGMKKHRTGAKTARDPNSNINKSLRRWHCESIEQMQELVMLAEQFIAKHKK
jgi:hypothetical protein